ncbi:hypothetical protein SBA1_430037 [Candidatus Sulfotelmatobacter kueseliae]|uniref:Uncharacterized protein n=1 Tax=Candidatus Sulfotelmatobacter kueseliae TaxID=2042962 RepID=A0A2U3KRE7_9BACT|nr:hypothetical protein SBA1_430037 [Candidatus Sulfotelmatobacter kueseliae]
MPALGADKSCKRLSGHSKLLITHSLMYYWFSLVETLLPSRTRNGENYCTQGLTGDL